jgi:hypothetical protein
MSRRGALIQTPRRLSGFRPRATTRGTIAEAISGGADPFAKETIGGTENGVAEQKPLTYLT